MRTPAPTDLAPKQRRIRTRSIFSLWLAIASGALSLPAWAATDGISVQLQPDRIALGQSATLVVTLDGTDSAARPQVPEVDGLQIRPAGQSSQIRVINGQASRSIAFTYRLEPEREGQFTIPAISTRSLKSEPVELIVDPAGAANPAGSGGPDAAASGDLAFLRIDRAETAGRDHLYVGELTPVAIRAFFREGIQVSQLSKPSITGGAFTLHQLSDQPKQQSTSIDGVRYRVLTWLGGLSGAKAADEELRATVEATIGIPTERQNRASRLSPFGGGSLFDDPFFDSAFDSFFQELEYREVTLSNEPLNLAIRALPSDGRPAGFAGAVGQFKLGSFSMPSELETGEPVDLRVTVTGKGNFDRVSSPRITPEAGWKTYPAKDTTAPADTIGWEAEKTFTLPAIALAPGERDVHFSFDYFDPESGTYQSITTQEIPVMITGNPVSGGAASGTSAPAESPEATLAPMRIAPGRLLGQSTPVYLRAWFIAIQGVAATTLIAAAMICLIRRRKEDPIAATRRAFRQAIDRQLVALTNARRSQDGAAFFAAARSALQHALAARWREGAPSITTEEVNQRLGPDSITARIFAMADAVEFSAVQVHPDSYGDWQARIDRALAEIEQPEPFAPAKNTPTWGEVPARTLTAS